MDNHLTAAALEHYKALLQSLEQEDIHTELTLYTREAVRELELQLKQKEREGMGTIFLCDRIE